MFAMRTAVATSHSKFMPKLHPQMRRPERCQLHSASKTCLVIHLRDPDTFRSSITSLLLITTHDGLTIVLDEISNSPTHTPPHLHKILLLASTNDRVSDLSARSSKRNLPIASGTHIPSLRSHSRLPHHPPLRHYLDPARLQFLRIILAHASWCTRLFLGA